MVIIWRKSTFFGQLIDKAPGNPVRRLTTLYFNLNLALSYLYLNLSVITMEYSTKNSTLLTYISKHDALPSESTISLAGSLSKGHYSLALLQFLEHLLCFHPVPIVSCSDPIGLSLLCLFYRSTSILMTDEGQVRHSFFHG